MASWQSLLFVSALGTAFYAEAAIATTGDKPSSEAAAGKENKPVKIKYKKRSQVDFSSQTVEGKLRRPETSLITASEGLNDQGILRLRENFLDKISSYSGEEVK